jgi:hypothetical protein
MPGRTAKYYASNPDARKKRLEYQREYNKKEREVKKRVELAKINREADKNGVNRNGKDYDHAVGKHVKSSINRGRAEKSRLKGSKRS